MVLIFVHDYCLIVVSSLHPTPKPGYGLGKSATLPVSGRNGGAYDTYMVRSFFARSTAC